MSHRKSHSHGSIPFSWEDKPGVCKTPNNDFPLNNIGSLQRMNQKPPSPLPPPPPHAPTHLSNSRRMLEFQDKKKKIPPPPCRSTSEKEKGFVRWQEDPFLVAYKECTKSEKKHYKVPMKNKKGGVVGSNFSLSKSIFSCRGANDVKDDIYVKLSCIAPARDRSLTFEGQQHKRGFNYETWL